MNVVVLGGVAAGTKAAAKLLRLDRGAKVTIYTKGKDISYAGCGLPYYVGGDIESREELIVNTPEKYTALTGAQVRTGMEAVALDAAARTVAFADGSVVSYDKLVIATGAVPLRSRRSRNRPCRRVYHARSRRPRSACAPMWKKTAAAARWWSAAASSAWKLRKTCWRGGCRSPWWIWPRR